MEKISSADLMTQAYGMFKSNRVFDFIESLDVDSDTAWKILDFLKDYSDMFVLSKKSDRDYYEEKIDHLERICGESASRLREIASLLEPEEE
ncbi:hypothetical protein EFR91_02965 [Lactobacillus amylovorus]|uniref:hypothetical protein n=1 Tax=Lactobacillus amylovorus TaxID=1604 RepID=UPI0021A7A7FE|nr:hypothetical protein [Lactobacillus amylovorus]MCT3595610.1 hypothetical protein [Lactobacillus amylovorus]